MREALLAVAVVVYGACAVLITAMIITLVVLLAPVIVLALVLCFVAETIDMLADELKKVLAYLLTKIP